jgi:hypothetical protein
VAHVLQDAGLATLLADLLTEQEAQDRRLVFDVGLLERRKKLVIVPGATHLFEEPGALEEVARLARDWFLRYLTLCII